MALLLNMIPLILADYFLLRYTHSLSTVHTKYYLVLSTVTNANSDAEPVMFSEVRVLDSTRYIIFRGNLAAVGEIAALGNLLSIYSKAREQLRKLKDEPGDE